MLKANQLETKCTFGERVNSLNKCPHLKSLPSEDWHREDIVCALHKSGTTVVALSLAAGLSASSLSNVFYRPWSRGERIIAARLGVAPSVIWPSRYPEKVCSEELLQG